MRRAKVGRGGSRVSRRGRHILLSHVPVVPSGIGEANAANGWHHCTGGGLVYVAISGLKASGGTISTYPVTTPTLAGVGDWLIGGGKAASAYAGVHASRAVATDSEFLPVIEPVTTNRPGRFENGTVTFTVDLNPTGIHFDIGVPEGTPGETGFRLLVNTNGSLVVGSYAFNLMQITAVFSEAYEVDEYSFGLNIEDC